VKLTWLQLTEGAMIPRGWGIAYYDLHCARATILPIPLNWVAGILREFWFQVKRGFKPGDYQRAIHQVARLQGQLQQYRLNSDQQSASIQELTYENRSLARWLRVYAGYVEDTRASRQRDYYGEVMSL
jgi:hypothetical protein